MMKRMDAIVQKKGEKGFLVTDEKVRLLFNNPFYLLRQPINATESPSPTLHTVVEL
jgi:hypothetical protein